MRLRLDRRRLPPPMQKLSKKSRLPTSPRCQRKKLLRLRSQNLVYWMRWSVTSSPRSGMVSCRKLNSFVSDLEASLGDSFLAEAPVVKAEPRSKLRAVQEPEPKPAPVAAKSAISIPASAPAAQVPAAM